MSESSCKYSDMLWNILIPNVCLLFCGCVLNCCMASCSAENDDMDDYYVSYIDSQDNKFVNCELPAACDTLRILSLGNSFSMDMLSDLPLVASSAGIASSRYSVYMVSESGCSLKEYASALTNDVTVKNAGNDSKFELYYMGGARIESLECSQQHRLSAILSQPWDVIVLQQCSASSSDFSTYNPYLTYLMLRIKTFCPNQSVSFLWHQTWSYPSDSKKTPRGLWGYEQICQAVVAMASECGLKNVIPVGTAVQNFRVMGNLGYGYELTRDGVHLDLTVGRLLAAMTFFNTVFVPVLHGELGRIDSEVICEEKNIDARCFEACRLCVKNSGKYPLWITYADL